MNAFFSSTDTKDEVAGRYFGVIGKIFDELPALALKASFNRQGVLLGYHDLFDINTEKLHDTSNYYLNYEELKHLIKERTYIYPKYAGYNKAASNTGYKKPTTFKSKPKNITVTPRKKDIYDFEDLDDDDWADLQNVIESDADFSLVNYLDKEYNLLDDTLFATDPLALTNFMYDFRKVFKSKLTDCSEKDIRNIFQSLFDLILTHNDIDEDAFNAAIQEIKLTYAEIFSTEVEVVDEDRPVAVVSPALIESKK